MLQIRNIPAHAGKTDIVLDQGTDTEKHPRSRGENEKEAENVNGAAETSPLTRGKRKEVPASNLEPGNIPAHAGKTEAKEVHQ